PGDGGRDDAGQRRDAELLRVLRLHEHQGGGAVVERAAVAGGDGAAGAEDGVERGDRLEGDAGARGVVGVDDAAVGQGDGGDVAGGEAGGDRGFGAVLGAHRVLVLRLPGHAAQLGDVLGGLAHGDVGVGQLAVLARVVPGGGDLPGGALLGALPGLPEARVA